MKMPLALLLSALSLPAVGVWAAGLRERDSAYAAAGSDCRKALSLFPNDNAVEVAPARFVCGASFYFYSQRYLDSTPIGDSGSGIFAGLRARSKSRRSLIAYGYDKAGKIEIRGDSVTVWRNFSARFGRSEADPRLGRLSASEVKTLEILVAAAPGGLFDSQYLVDIEKDPLWISIYGTKLIEIGPRTYIWGEPLKDIGNLCRFLRTVSDRIAGKEVGPDALSPEALEKLEVE
jgi:hypothetical protein